MRLFKIWDQGHLDQLSKTLIHDGLPIVLVQILNRTLIDKGYATLGEANQYLEATAYAVLILKSISSLPWLESLREDIVSKMEQSQSFLRDCGTCWNKPQYMWVGKSTYGQPLISEAYYLAAMNKT